MNISRRTFALTSVAAGAAACHKNSDPVKTEKAQGPTPSVFQVILLCVLATDPTKKFMNV
jgi:hypothetical protein